MIAHLLALTLLAQALPAVGPRHQVRTVMPVLAFPEPGVDDTAAYRGYQTRFYRDSKNNTVQIYLEPVSGRVVQLWADAANESVGFTVRDAKGRPAPVAWDADGAQVADSGGTRTLEYRLTADGPSATFGWFLLGSMRVERDFQYDRRHLRPFAAPRYYVAEESLLVANLARLPVAEQQRELPLLRAPSVAALRARLQPTLASSRSDSAWTVRVRRPSLDGRSHLVLELRGDPREGTPRVIGRTVRVQARGGAPVRLTVRIATDAAPLTPLSRDQIFNRAFLDFLAKARADSSAVLRSRRLERDVRSVELLSSREKLMAGLPNFATYFGRDMMMSALMMRPIWSGAMSEDVIASVLRKLGPAGEVSHEEALGGQAVRETAAEYNGLLPEYFRLARGGRQARADSVLARARDLLRGTQTIRENYHMMDDEFQLVVLEARYLADSSIPADRKRSFLLARPNGGATRVGLMLREMALVASETRPYVEDPTAMNLVSFVKRDSTHWRSASWRDSDAGYANGRFAMDINAIWAPLALASIAEIRESLQAAGFRPDALDSIAPEIARTPLHQYLADSAALQHAVDTWRGARSHFMVALDRREVESRIKAKLAWLPETERSYWEKAMASEAESRDSLSFLALSLDAEGRPIPIVNTDPATGLFLDHTMKPDVVLGDVEPFVRPYPIGLLINGLGPVVANDAYAPPRVWEVFGKDAYHSPRVVWGREVNLLLLGLAGQIAAAYDASGRLHDRSLEPYVRVLNDALQRTLAAVNASGLTHNELWSYRIEGERLIPTRYGTSSDIQLWSTTDLAVQFALSRLPRP
ncbi:MAG TPA: hypothetical protein VHR41_02130 [Gemmatimonadales bacterium]|nr:hypothetical protein [Gemmatimonadales bacterium]